MLRHPLDERLGTASFGDTAAVTALLDGRLHHAHLLKCGLGSFDGRI